MHRKGNNTYNVHTRNNYTLYNKYDDSFLFKMCKDDECLCTLAKTHISDENVFHTKRL